MHDACELNYANPVPGTMPPCAAFAAELEVANAANAELKQKAASATTETEAAQKSNAELEKKAASAAAEMEAAKKSIAELEKKAASATAETEAAQKSNAKLEKKAASAAAEMEAAKKSIAKLEKKAASATAETEAAQKSNTELEQKAASAAAEMEAAKKSIAELEKKAASATAEMEAAKKSIAEFEKKATSATAEMEAAQKSIAELKKKAASATAEVEMPSLTWTEILVLPMSLAVMMAGTLVVRTGSALWGGKGFPVTHTIQDGKRVVAVECAGVSIHNVRIEYDGRSKGTIQIDRTEAFGLPAISCKQDFQLEDEGSWFEWLQSETRPGVTICFIFSVQTGVWLLTQIVGLLREHILLNGSLPRPHTFFFERKTCAPENHSILEEVTGLMTILMNNAFL